MVSAKSVEDQLKKIHYNKGWNRPETDELATILLPDEEIFECVSGWYEGGFALLCATNIRVLLIDKKPFKFLTIEDVRFDTINQIDYFHRMFNASICITAGLKNLTFRSYNQPRLRKLIGHVQHRMAEIKRLEQADRAKMEGNVLEMDQHLRDYLLSQYEQHKSLMHEPEPSPAPIILDSHYIDEAALLSKATITKPEVDVSAVASGVPSGDLYEDGIKELYGKYQSATPTDNDATTNLVVDNDDPLQLNLSQNSHAYDTNPLKIACSKLPQILSLKRSQAAASSV